jgi:hypothetical protein
MEVFQSNDTVGERIVVDTLGTLEKREERAPELPWIREASLTEVLKYES